MMCFKNYQLTTFSFRMKNDNDKSRASLNCHLLPEPIRLRKKLPDVSAFESKFNQNKLL